MLQELISNSYLFRLRTVLGDGIAISKQQSFVKSGQVGSSTDVLFVAFYQPHIRADDIVVRVDEISTATVVQYATVADNGAPPLPWNEFNSRPVIFQITPLYISDGDVSRGVGFPRNLDYGK